MRRQPSDRLAQFVGFRDSVSNGKTVCGDFSDRKRMRPGVNFDKRNHNVILAKAFDLDGKCIHFSVLREFHRRARSGSNRRHNHRDFNDHMAGPSCWYVRFGHPHSDTSGPAALMQRRRASSALAVSVVPHQALEKRQDVRTARASKCPTRNLLGLLQQLGAHLRRKPGHQRLRRSLHFISLRLARPFASCLHFSLSSCHGKLSCRQV